MIAFYLTLPHATIFDLPVAETRVSDQVNIFQDGGRLPVLPVPKSSVLKINLTGG